MRRSQTKAKLIAVWLFIFGVIAIPAFAQEPATGITMDLSVSNVEFSESMPPTATITIRNDSGSVFSMKDFASRLDLDLDPLPIGSCRMDECYTAFLYLDEKKIAHGKSQIFMVKLNQLHWHNSISSILNGARPKNLFTLVPAGKYGLRVTLQRRLGTDPKSGVPRNFTIRSSVVREIKLTPGK